MTSGAGFSEALGALRDALGRARAASLDGWSAAELGEAAVGLDRLVSGLRREQARVVARFDAVGGAAAVGLPSTGAWLRSRTTAAASESAELVRVGRALRDRLLAVDAALSAGDVGWRAACVIEAGLRPVRDPAVVAQAQELLADQARRLSVGELQHAARRVLQWIDPDAAQRGAAARYEARCLSLAPMLDGAVAIAGQLDEEGAAIVQSALGPLLRPRGPEDRRTAGQRRADALVELVAKAAEHGAAGTRTAAGLPPTLLVRVDVERLAADDDDSAAVAELDWGGPILPETLARIGCSAQVVRVVTAGASRVLDVGAAQRLATPAQRIALAARDRGCAFPGCDRPPGWTDAHHITAWTRDGPTDLHNLISLCRFHHRLHHEGGWTIRRTRGGLHFADPDGAVRAAREEPIVG